MVPNKVFTWFPVFSDKDRFRKNLSEIFLRDERENWSRLLSSNMNSTQDGIVLE